MIQTFAVTPTVTAKPRSRSLIRRSSWRMKQKIKDAKEEDCTVS